MTVWLLCLFSSHRVYNCTYYCCSTSRVFAFLKIWEVFASSLLWSHENITSPLRTWGLLYVINSITTEKKKGISLWFYLQRKTFVIHDNKMRTIDWNCSVVPCVTQDIFHVWMKQSFTISHPHTSFHALSNGHLLLQKSQGAHRKTSTCALLVHLCPLSSRRAKGLKHFPFLQHLTLQSWCSFKSSLS